MGNFFDFEKVVTIGDTNAMQNLYFSEYFKIQGTVRELWVKDHVPNYQKYFKEGLLLSTKYAHCDYIKPFFLYDILICRMYIIKIGLVRAKIGFDFINKATNELSATGYQLIVFKDHNRKTCAMPDGFKEALLPFVREEIPQS